MRVTYMPGGNNMLAIDSVAPDFNLDGSGGRTVSLQDLRGKFAVIVFYPKNNTPG